VVKTKLCTYGIIFGLLIGILESNGIPVLSFFGKTAINTEQTTSKQAEDPIKESENFRVEPSSWLHQTIAFNFTEPVFLLPVKYHAGFTSKFPYSYYPDVLTPPPNC
jgi:hypothetical protein